MRVLVTGASGFIGSALLRALAQRGDEVVEVVRHSPAPGQARIDLDAGTIDCSALPGGGPGRIDAAVHLAGAPILGRWSARRRELIRSSRIATGQVVAGFLAGLGEGPTVYATGSAVGFYGETGESELDEDGPAGTGFLAEVCKAWEASAAVASEAGIRVVALRTGVVLGPGGGALGAQLPAFRRGLGARLGSGRQWTSWISLADALGAMVRVLDDAELVGPVNLTSPSPVRNAELTDAIARAVGRRAHLAVPSVALRLALGGVADEMLLVSQRVRPSRLVAAGYAFEHPTIDAALAEAVAR